MLIFLLQSVKSTLHRGDNPYSILGVKRTATDQEIKKAYHDITMKHHPDLHKTKEDEKLWIRASDAYEILKDPTRRQIFDQTGDVSDEPIESPHQNDWYQPPGPGSGNKRRGPSHGPFDPNFGTEEINSKTLEDILDSAESHDIVVFLYHSRDFLTTLQYNQIFETVADEFKDFIHFYHNDVRVSGSLLYDLNIKSSVPAVLYVIKKHGRIITKITSDINSPAKIRKFLERCMQAQVETFTKISKLNAWIEANSAYPRLICFDRPKNPPRKVIRASGLYPSVRIAYVSTNLVECVREFKLKSFPANLLIRGVVREEIYDIFFDLKGMDVPILAKLSARNFKRDCENPSILFVGKPENIPQANRTTLEGKIQATSVYTEPGSAIARAMHLKEGEWAIFSSADQKFLKIPPKMTFQRALKDFKKGKGENFTGQPPESLAESCENFGNAISDWWEQFSVTNLIFSLLGQPLFLLFACLIMMFLLPRCLLSAI